MSEGIASYHTRVERWECDFNDHWNVRFYIRSIQMAAEGLAARAGLIPAPDAVRARHLRFHGELRDGAPVELRSGVVGEGAFAGCLLHLLFSAERLAATALDFDSPAPPGLPEISPVLTPLFRPRGLDARPQNPEAAPDASPFVVQLGIARPGDFDHAGRFLDEAIMRQVSVVSSAFLAARGFTPAFTAKTGINRMSVESRYSRNDRCRVGDAMTADARLQSVGHKSFVLSHSIRAGDQCFATVEHALVAVGLTTRRIVPLPLSELSLS